MRITVEHGQFQHSIDFPLSQYEKRWTSATQMNINVIYFVMMMILMTAGLTDPDALAIAPYAVLVLSGVGVLYGLFKFVINGRQWQVPPVRYEGNSVETNITPIFMLGNYKQREKHDEALPESAIYNINPYLAHGVGSDLAEHPIEYLLTMEEAKSLEDYPYSPESIIAYYRLPQSIQQAMWARITSGRKYAKGFYKATHPHKVESE